MSERPEMSNLSFVVESFIFQGRHAVFWVSWKIEEKHGKTCEAKQKKTCSGSTKECPKVIGCPTFGRQGYVSTRNSEPANCHHIYRILRTYQIYLEKKDPFPVPGQGSPSHVYRSAIRLKHFLKSPPRSCRLRASQVMKAMLKKLQGLRSHKSSTCILWLSTTLASQAGKAKTLVSFPKTQNFLIPSLLLREGLFSPSFQKDADSQDDQTYSDSHEDPQIPVVNTPSPPPLCCGSERYMNDLYCTMS